MPARTRPLRELVLTLWHFDDVLATAIVVDGHQACARAVTMLIDAAPLRVGYRLTVTEMPPDPTEDLPETSRASHYS